MIEVLSAIWYKLLAIPGIVALHYIRLYLIERYGTYAAVKLLSLSGVRKMFEKKNEIDQKLGEFGHALVDITPDLNVDASLVGGFKKDVIAEIPGALSIEIEVSTKLHADPIGLGLHFISKSENSTVKFIADQLAKLKAGVAIHPDVQAAADAHASANPVA